MISAAADVEMLWASLQLAGKISSLAQLDNIDLDQFKLVPVRLLESPDGQCIGDLATSIWSVFTDPEDRRQFSVALLRLGLSPGDWRARFGTTASISQLQFYPCSEELPRLLLRSMSPAINDACHVLELAYLASKTEPSAINVYCFIMRRQ